MFNQRRELRMQVVKAPKPEPTPEPRLRNDPLLINALVRANVRDAAILAGLGFTLKRVLDTCSEVAIIAAKANIK